MEENTDKTVHLCNQPGLVQSLVLVSHHMKSLMYRTLINHLNWMTEDFIQRVK